MLGRAIGVLDAFGEGAEPELSLTELADRAELPLTTTHRLAGQLVRERLLERLPSGRFRIGSHVQELGALASGFDDDVVSAARPFLEDLAEATGRTVQLVALDGLEAVVADIVGGPESVLGARAAAYATSGGLVLLAHAPASLVDRLLARPLDRYGEGEPVTPARVRAVIGIARAQGHLEVRGRAPSAAMSVAAPVLLPGEAPAAVSIVGAPAGAPSLVPAVLTTARGIARSLGAPRTAPISVIPPAGRRA